MHYSDLLPKVLSIADTAGADVMRIYNSDFEVTYKADQSPVTAADIAAHETILAGLERLTPNTPVLSEEAALAPWKERQHWARFWLVDPVDGTKEFTHRTGEFTVNIALIEHGEPVLGVVTAPALKEAFWGVKSKGAYKRDSAGKIKEIKAVKAQKITRVMASKSHLNEETKAFIEALGEHQLLQAGSSLKFCRIAEGAADIYPRLGPTSEWDTAAAQAVLVAAGGSVKMLDGTPLEYGKENVLNPHFIAAGNWHL
jgi:3'(2'), 5'-bisphosphate nucleotidase